MLKQPGSLWYAPIQPGLAVLAFACVMDLTLALLLTFK